MVINASAEELTVAKGQDRGRKEVKKPKTPKAV